MTIEILIKMINYKTDLFIDADGFIAILLCLNVTESNKMKSVMQKQMKLKKMEEQK